jgi:hypothetical protein
MPLSGDAVSVTPGPASLSSSSVTRTVVGLTSVASANSPSLTLIAAGCTPVMLTARSNVSVTYAGPVGRDDFFSRPRAAGRTVQENRPPRSGKAVRAASPPARRDSLRM